MPVEDGYRRVVRRRFGSVARATVIAVALALLSQAPQVAIAQTDSGSIGVRLLDVPAAAAEDSRARQYIVDRLEPGATITRRFEISNTAASPVTVSVYASGAKIVKGAFLGDAGRVANDLTERTSIEQADIIIPAKTAVIDTVTIAIPTDAAPGEQYAAIWAEARSSGDGAVEIVNRVGIRMYVAVGGSNAAASSFDIESLTASRTADGAAVVTALIHNTGGRAIDASARLTLTRVGGTLTAGPYSSSSAVTIAPGGKATVPVALTDDVVAGPWDASIAVTSGLLAVTSESRLTFPAKGTGTEVAATPSASGIPVWVWVALLALVLIAALTGALFARRRTRAKRLGALSAPEPEK